MDILSFLAPLGKALQKYGAAAILAIALLGAYMWGVGHKNMDAAPLLLVIAFLYGGFLFRDVLADRHKERMEIIAIKKLETESERLKVGHRRRNSPSGTGRGNGRREG